MAKTMTNPTDCGYLVPWWVLFTGHTTGYHGTWESFPVTASHHGKQIVACECESLLLLDILLHTFPVATALAGTKMSNQLLPDKPIFSRKFKILPFLPTEEDLSFQF